MVITLIEKVYSFLWGDLFQIPLPGGGSVGISLLIILLIPTGIYFTIRTRFLPIRLFPEMVRSLNSKKGKEDGLSNFQTLIVSTATRVGMGNLVGVVAAISAGGAGAVFWMWITALIGSSTAFVEATLAQLHKEKDPLYGGYRGGPAYYIHHYMEEHQGKKKRYSVIAVLFAISGLICWCGISQVISNSVTSSFENAFSIPPIYTTVILVVLAAVIVLRKNATVKVLDVVVPIMAVCYFLISAGGAGAVFWMWITALIGSSTAFVEATLAQLHKEKDPLYGGYRGGPAYYIHHYMEEHQGKKKRYSVIAVLFAISGLICWCGISQVISNSVTSSFENAFSIPPIYTTVILVVLAAVIVLRKNATVKVLDVVVPIMAVCYFLITVFLILTNLSSIPGVFSRIFEEAFGVRQVAAGGFGAVLMNGVKRGLFSNEAGSGSAPCAAAAAECDLPVKAGLVQALGVFIDTIVICSCTAMIMLLVPQDQIEGLAGMELLQTAMRYHLGEAGVIFIAVMLFLFSFSTFLGILFYARSNVAYLFGDNWASQTAYKVLALVMLFIGGIAAYTFVWDLGDVGIGLMTVFNTVILYLMGGQALDELKKYEAVRKEQKKKN